MSTLETYGRKQNIYFNADELVDTHFPDPRWAVPGLIAEGLTLFGGAPKIGKSWFALGLGISVAGGMRALGKIPVEPGPVLYAALEDPARRLKSRLQTILGSEPAPANLTIVTSLPPLTEAIDLISEWLDEHSDARLVIIDVLAKIRPPMTSSSTSMYAADYRIMSDLKTLAERHKVGIVVITHLRKMADGDVFNEVTGSTGITGSVDTTLVVKRTRGEHAAALHVTGRDVVESEYAITFNPADCTWRLDGEALAEAAKKAHEVKVSEGLGETAFDVIRLLGQYPEGIGPTAVGEALGMTPAAAGVYLDRLLKAGRIVKLGRGLYAVESVETADSEHDARVLDFNTRVESVETEASEDLGFNAFNTFNTPPEGSGA